MTDSARCPRAPSLERLLRERSRAELSEFFSFWDGAGPPPKTSDALVEALVRRMTSEDSVRKRLKFLSKKLVDLLKFLIRDRAFTATRDHVLQSRLFNYMSQYEVEAALNALQKRGFVFQTAPGPAAGGRGNGHGNGDAAFSVPDDLGQVLHAFLRDEECTPQEIFSLRAWLKKFGPPQDAALGALLAEPRAIAGADEAIQALCSPSEIAHRIGLLDEPVKAQLAAVIAEAGGFASKSQYDRQRRGLPRWERKKLKEAVEGLLLGTVRHLALGEYGINHFDDTLVLFDEAVAVWRREVGPDPARELADVRTCGVDMISDISNFLSFVAHNKVRLTLNGQIYRTVTKKLTEQFILCRKKELEGIDPFQFLYSFCVARKLVERRPDRSLHITVKGRCFEAESLEKKLKALLDFALKEQPQDGESFHAPRLREHVLELLGTQQVGKFADLMALPFAARNAYLARLEVDHVRDAFQNRYQYAATAAMRDAAGLAEAVHHWLRDRLYLLGLVDLGFRNGAAAAVRLTPLGARALGRALPEELARAGRPLMVNPDFEVVLFPEGGETYDLITRLDRFAERQSSDAVYRYKLSAPAIEKAVAEGMDVAEILRILSENARGAIPQNVVYSLKEWAGKVRFLSARRVTLLRGRNREIMDRVVRALGALGVVCDRLSPTALVVADDCDLARLEEDLVKAGVFLEGEGKDGVRRPAPDDAE